MWAWNPHVHMRVRLLTRGGKILKIQPPINPPPPPPNLFIFVTINSVQNFKTVAKPLSGEKFVWVGVWCVNQI